MMNTQLPHEIQGRAIPWHELNPDDLATAARIAHRACKILKNLMDERQIPLLPHQQLPEPRLIAMDVALLKLNRRDADLSRLLNAGADDFMSDIVTLMTHINRVDGIVSTLVHFRCANPARIN
jgi:hypothetical protein